MKSLPITLALLAVALFLASGYFGRYWLRAKRDQFPYLRYGSPDEARLFYPAMYVEEVVTGHQLRVGCRTPHGPIMWEVCSPQHDEQR
jgi:hypothetical protein